MCIPQPIDSAGIIKSAAVQGCSKEPKNYAASMKCAAIKKAQATSRYLHLLAKNIPDLEVVQIPFSALKMQFTIDLVKNFPLLKQVLISDAPDGIAEGMSKT